MEELYIKKFSENYEDIEKEIRKGIIGQDNVIRNVLIGIIAGGNVLLEGMPGLGKTQLVKTIGKVLDLDFSRIQFTPDLMPSDIIGTEIVTKKDSNIDFVFKKGPIFSSIVLADEINRATPKTQSALLEAMEEKRVTVGNTTYVLPEPFFVLATQNPLETEGTYPLPEAQLDRFMLKVNIKLPQFDDISSIVDLTTGDCKLDNRINKILQSTEIMKMRETSRLVLIGETVKKLAINIVTSTYSEKSDVKIVKDYVKCGASLRGIQAIILAAKVRALIEGRYNVALEDIKEMAYPCLRHRIILNFNAFSDRVSADDIIKEILSKVN
ncbi:MoxR-like ATPase [Clostridium tetanomorphum]|uniref:AAA domain-containing protein n=1 Tax=Clostridium tetanomorphum TaxID=1553 RepID=A0A923J1U3_CLOTT|nr:AAA family ATPase [Clostridium tetanomorphum]KAJ48948.1 regulatory protein moxR [Clostridium tetanomorphum DSM 665]KAJ49665.1 regulatory protein moxR [Clostridium tetanomorphum DSM 665]MBC2397733.1 AAA domain-containing protein [Clostridium tetanomorphum]MBP1865088.1 MoxR-like ATPase [Clostridium tetanomorphum]NRS83314.1 MoxR-like ATPase [Clostridium tetanomorphum]